MIDNLPKVLKNQLFTFFRQQRLILVQNRSIEEGEVDKKVVYKPVILQILSYAAIGV